MDLQGLGLSAGLFRVVRLMKWLGLLRFLTLFVSYTFIAFVCAAKAIMVIITQNEYAKEREAPSDQFSDPKNPINAKQL